MRPPERPYYKEPAPPPGKTRRQFKHPLQSLQTQLRPYDGSEWKPPQRPSTQGLQSQDERDSYEQDSHIYEEIDDSLPADLFDVNFMSSMRLMQVSGAMRAIRLLPHGPGEPLGQPTTGEEWWTGGSSYPQPHLPSSNGVWSEPISEGLTQVGHPENTTTTPMQPVQEKRVFWRSPIAKVVITLLVGIGMLALVARFVNIPLTLYILKSNLETPRGVIFATLAGISLASAYCIRGARWRLFLLPIGKVSLLQAIQLFWIAIFINFILPVQGGELAKSLMLKRICNIPVSQSLPTVAMDKALDLLPALFIMVLVPFIPGIHMNPTLWVILGFVGSILIGLICAVVIMAISRRIATRLIRLALSILPQGLAEKIESFAFGFIDSLLAGASRPKIFIPAVLLTLIAVGCDGLFALFSFWTVGVSSMTFWIAIFGYAVYTMFYILPTPPGHVGSNEFAGFIVFSQLLGYKQNDVTAMFIFSHPLGALIMGIACMICLSGLGLSFSNAISLKHEDVTAVRHNSH